MAGYVAPLLTTAKVDIADKSAGITAPLIEFDVSQSVTNKLELREIAIGFAEVVA